MVVIPLSTAIVCPLAIGLIRVIGWCCRTW
jgi:hypothetical protein